MSITVSIDAAAVDRVIARVMERMRQPRALNQALAFSMGELVRSSFADTRDPWGAQWAPLSPVTIARRRKQSAIPLRDTGLLMSSIVSSATDSTTTISVGRIDRPAHVHQFGNPYNRMFGRALAPIPARPFFPVRSSRVVLSGTEYPGVIADVVKAFVEGSLQ